MKYSRYWLFHRTSTALLSAIGALIFALAYFAVSTWEVTRVEGNQRSQLVEMTREFVSVFAEHRGDGAVIPATFRRMGIERFTNRKTKSDNGIRTTVRMPGSPGLALRVFETNPRIREIIDGFVSSAITQPVSEHRLENGRFIGRTIYPSIASSESCVSCHNDVLGEGTYEIGDVMGAFVVESDLTERAWRNARYAVGAFGVALLAFAALARREQRRMQEVVNNLEARVDLEKKNVKAEAHAKFLTSHDALTGLPNRAMFTDRLARDMTTGSQDGITVIIIDLDDFKTVNDTMGHGAGDALLTEVARRLKNMFDTCDGLVARLGGDEFAIVFRAGAQFPTPDAAGNAILLALHPAFSHEEYEIQPRCSVGIAVAEPHGETTPDELLRYADAALYEAKAKGKDLFRVFDDITQSSLVRRAEIGSQLPEAILRGHIRAVLQPQQCLISGKFVGFEALGRWRMSGEDIPPEEFVPIAEKIGMIRDLDLAVLRAAAEFVATEERNTGISVPLSANISALNFRSPGLAEAIQDIIWQTRLSPDRLTLEVTESAAVENWDAVHDVLAVLRPMGVRASLDDFGTGYSSLSYLRRFKFEEIKIDRDFISDISVVEETRFLFQSMVNMAKGLGSKIVVEGIETVQQSRIVSDNGAEIGQGYLFSKPLELEDAREYLRQKTSFVA